MTPHKYTVADVSFEVSFPERFTSELMFRYEPFLNAEAEPDFRLKVTETEVLQTICTGEFIDKYNDEPPYLWLYRSGNDYFCGFSLNDNNPSCYLSGDNLYLKSRLTFAEAETCITNALMLLYTKYSSTKGNLMIHASTVSYQGKAYIFLGKSGTGKSTHSRLWLKHIEACSLLNDDNPVVKVEEDGVYVYGTPWSGKTHCYKNEKYPLGAIVRLSQEPQNTIKKLGIVQSFASFMPSCSNVRWDKISSEATSKTIEKTILKVPCYHLGCLPDKEAAELCCNTITK
jgi:hypothetical protein